MSELVERLAQLRARIERAALAVDRDPAAVKLLAVSKTQPPESVLAAVRAGLLRFGENRVQEAEEKIPAVTAVCEARLEWHLIGGLQRNKARRAVELFAVIESVDRLELLVALEKAASEQGVRPRVLLQVNIDREPQKGGCMPSKLAALAAEADACPNLELIGLMAIPRACDNPEQIRPAFARLRGLLADLNRTRPRERALAELSMGMSGDFEVAVQEGATLLRIGTALFGEREDMTGLPETVGTIGAGNMAEAILRGLLRAGVSPAALCAADPEASRRERMQELGVRTTSSNLEVAQSSQLVVLAVKPQQLADAAATLPRDGGPLYLSIVAGATTAVLRKRLGADSRIVRSMPNTPALVGAGITAVASDTGAAPADLDLACAVLRAVGTVVRVPESALDAVTGLSGSGPAYVFAFIEALTEAGKREGLPLATARALALETVHGAARLALDSGEDPALLRERVTSPGGTTIAGLSALFEGGFREAILAAVHRATERSKALAGGD